MYLSTKSKLELVKTAGEQGLLSDNQKLALLGYPPITGGERITQSLNYIDKSLISAYQMNQSKTKTERVRGIKNLGQKTPEQRDHLLNRFYELQEIRALEPSDEESEAIVEGFAIPYEVETNVGNWFIEVIKRGALDGADLKDVPFFIHHNGRAIPLARSRNNNANSSMQLMVTERGLEFRTKLDIENNAEAKALYEITSEKNQLNQCNV